MPFIPEEKLDRALEHLDDLTEAIRIQRQALETLCGILAIHGQWLAKIYAEITKKRGDDPLSSLLYTLIEADKDHAATLQRVRVTLQQLAQTNIG